MVKRLPTMQKTWVRSLGWEDPLEKEIATHSSTLAWKIPWMEESGKLQSMGSQRVGQDLATSPHFPCAGIIERQLYFQVDGLYTLPPLGSWFRYQSPLPPWPSIFVQCTKSCYDSQSRYCTALVLFPCQGLFPKLRLNSIILVFCCCLKCLFIFYLFIIIFGCTGSSLMHSGFLQLQRAGGYSSCSALASHHSSFSCCGAWTLGHTGFSSCCMWAQQLWLMGYRARELHQLQHMGLVAPWHVESSQTRD